MPILQEVIDYLHTIAPNHYQEPYDNSGLLIGDSTSEVKGVVVSLDVTEAILDEAIDLGANVIVSHHPIIFSGLKRITGRNYVERIVAKAIKNDINLFSIHTNLDNVYDHGVNTRIAERLSLVDVQILKPNLEMNDNAKVGAGVIGKLENPMSEVAFLEDLKQRLNVSIIKYTALRDRPIERVAICGGSGRFLLETAKAQKADIFISSDFKYHEFFDADNQIVIADVGHFESEQYTINLLFEILTQKFNNFATHFTKVNTNPVNYL
jgi:dinuclear metal center YbgI/SA1388 family protein